MNYIEPSVIRTTSRVIFVPNYDVVALYGSCQQVLSSFPDGYFGALLTDPPAKIEGVDDCLAFLKSWGLSRFIESGSVSVVLTNPIPGYVLIDDKGAKYVSVPELQWKHDYGHPHSRPVEQLTRLMMLTTGTVLDPFMGSGSTLVAAQQLGRKAVGIELHKDYFSNAVDRIYGQGTP